MRSEYDQEIVRRIFCNSPEQAGHRDLIYVRSQHKINDDQEGQKVCGVIRAGVSSQVSDKGGFVPYTRDIVIRPISMDLCRLKMHIL